MKRLLASSLFATVQVLMVTFSAGTAAAATEADCQAKSRNGTTYSLIGGECRITDCGRGRDLVENEVPGKDGQIVTVARCVAKKERENTTCVDQAKNISKGIDERAKACSEAGIDVGSCVQQVERCLANANDDEDNAALGEIGNQALQQFMPSLGQTPLNISSLLGPNGEKCPNEGSKDYFEEKDRLQRDLKDIDRENADIAKDIAEEKSKLDKDLKEAQEDLARSEKDANKRKAELEKEKGEASSQHAKNSSDIAEKIRKLQIEELNKRAEVQKYESEHNRRLLQLNEQMAKAKCLAQVKATQEEMKKAGLFNATGSTFMANATAKQKVLQEAFDSCIADFKAQRIQLYDEYRSRLRLMNEQVTQINHATDEAHQEMKASQTQTEQTIAQLNQQQTQEDQALAKAMQNATQNLQNQQQTTISRQQALATKQASLTQRKLDLQKQLIKLGPEPKRGAKTGWRDAQRAVYELAQKRADFEECCTKGRSLPPGSDSPDAEFNDSHAFCRKPANRDEEKLINKLKGKTRTGRSSGGTPRKN